MSDLIEQKVQETLASEIQQALEVGQIEKATNLLLNLHPADQAEIYQDLSQEHQTVLLPSLGLPDIADLLEELEDDEALVAVEELPTEYLADVLDEMEPDEAADLLGDLPAEKATEVLAQMEIAAEVEPLLAYPDETAGGLMTTWYIALRPQNTVAQAIGFLRQVSPETDVPYYLYVVDHLRRLIGITGLRDLVISEPETLIQDILDPEIIYVTADTDQEEAARIMSRYSLSALPVVDNESKLIGVITHDDIVEVLENEATEDIYRLANVSDSDLEPDSPILDQIKGRLPWMYFNTATALLASWVISQFESVIASVAILAALQTIVAGLGGNSANQNMTLVVRALALGKTDRRTVVRSLIQQLLVGLLVGLAVGIVVGFGIFIWRSNFHLGLILGLAMVANMLIAAIVGTLIPIGLRAIGQDPAIASTVVVTAITDSLGFLIFLSLAAVFLPYLI